MALVGTVIVPVAEMVKVTARTIIIANISCGCRKGTSPLSLLSRPSARWVGNWVAVKELKLNYYNAG